MVRDPEPSRFVAPLLMLFPGQRIWAVRLHGPGGALYTIVGDPNPGEEA